MHLLVASFYGLFMLLKRCECVCNQKIIIIFQMHVLWMTCGILNHFKGLRGYISGYMYNRVGITESSGRESKLYGSMVLMQ